MKTGVLLPARNEAPRIAQTLAAIKTFLPDAIVLVVDGASKDGTSELARRAGAHVLHFDRAGYARALAMGYRASLDLGVDRLIQMDADGQHPPHAAPMLLDALGPANMVIGSRHGTGSPGSIGRRSGNAVLALLVRVLVGQNLKDVTSGFWAMDHRTLTAFSRCFPDDVADANIRVLATRMGLRLEEKAVRMPLRSGGRSMHDGIHGVANMVRSLWAAVREASSPPPPSPLEPARRQ